MRISTIYVIVFLVLVSLIYLHIVAGKLFYTVISYLYSCIFQGENNEHFAKRTKSSHVWKFLWSAFKSPENPDCPNCTHKCERLGENKRECLCYVDVECLEQ